MDVDPTPAAATPPPVAPPSGEAPGTPETAGPAAVDLDAVRDDLGAVEAALERLDAGTYGTCATCGAALPDDDLAADPTRRACATHGA
ncbi:hypothetical protein PO878_19950 [Iamia majanohamensis]|uniref:DksA C4-type domain-containing protein n=1 Tax=Iamia majanohamensis TaxID=467976 RepID=A0AAE9Y5B5_9ACTN|nr:hypothetical protein [Iamia majanohamensis]WCO66769.1 hypothetical protein PO878_19950 [Iamia majanohamensis]